MGCKIYADKQDRNHNDAKFDLNQDDDVAQDDPFDRVIGFILTRSKLLLSLVSIDSAECKLSFDTSHDYIIQEKIIL